MPSDQPPSRPTDRPLLPHSASNSAVGVSPLAAGSDVVDPRTRGTRERRAADGPRHEPPAPADIVTLDADALNTVIQEVFAVGLTLAGCASRVEPWVADRLTAGIDGLDEVIAHLRAAAFGPDDGRAGTLTCQRGGPSAEDDLDTILYLLDRAARSAGSLLERAVAEGTDASHLVDGAHSIYRAIITLSNSARFAVHAGCRHR